MSNGSRNVAIFEEIAKNPALFTREQNEHTAKHLGISIEEFDKGVEAAKRPVFEEADLSPSLDPFPEFPRLFGPLDEVATVVSPSLAYEHKVLHLLTCVGLSISGRVSLATDPWTQPRFYSCMIGPPGSTKTAVDKELRRLAFPKGTTYGGSMTYSNQPLDTEIGVELSINSGPALVEALAEHPRLLIATDELSSLFEKARQTANSPNSLFGELLRLYESNEIGRRVVRKGNKDSGAHTTITDAHLAIIAGATTESFERIWIGTGGASSGLQSRFVLSYSEKALPPFQTLTDDKEARAKMTDLVVSVRKAPPTLSMRQEAQDAVIEWSKGFAEGPPPRALDMAKRVSMIVASCGGRSTVDEEVMKWSLAFADYQVKLKERLMPRDSDGVVQAMENRIFAFLDRVKRASARQVRRNMHPERFPGGVSAFERAWSCLVRTRSVICKEPGLTGKQTIYERD